MIKITGSEQLREFLLDLPDALHDKVLKKSVKSGVDVASTLMKPLLPYRYGVLRRSMATKVKLYKEACWGGAGPDSSYSEYIKGKKIRPSKYFHLLDLGFFNKKANRFIPGRRIVEKISQSSLIESAYFDKAQAEAEKIWQKG